LFIASEIEGCFEELAEIAGDQRVGRVERRRDHREDNGRLRCRGF
jgi:hypothetical protein